MRRGNLRPKKAGDTRAGSPASIVARLYARARHGASRSLSNVCNVDIRKEIKMPFLGTWSSYAISFSHIIQEF